MTLDERFLASVLPLLTKRMTIRNGFEALSCLLLVFKTQEAVSSLPKKSVKLPVFTKIWTAIGFQMVVYSIVQYDYKDTVVIIFNVTGYTETASI